MKQIKVSKQCNGCGICIVNCSYLTENEDGNAEPVVGLAIKTEDLAAVQQVVAECPEGALSIVEAGAAAHTGKDGIRDIIADLEKKCENFKVKRIKESDVRFKASSFSISASGSRNEHKRNYHSESDARRGAKSDFDDMYYSENGFKPILKKVFVEYKLKKVKPFYIREDDNESYYFQFNEQIRAYLADAYAELATIVGEDNIPAGWKEFSVYPSAYGDSKPLEDFEAFSTECNIISTLKERSGTSLNDYVDRMNFVCDEVADGKGLFGKPKTVKRWFFTGYGQAARAFIQDLKWAMDKRSSYIEGVVVRFANITLESLEENIKKEFSKKIKELEMYLK